ncbi:hypothetical protein ACWEKM_19395 [Streptomyces sp. NPDC004752]
MLGEPTTADVTSLLTHLPMGLGSTMTTLKYAIGNSGTGSPLMSGMTSASMMAMGLGRLGHNGTQRKSQMLTERRAYLRYLDQVRPQVRHAAATQRAAAHIVHPTRTTCGTGRPVRGPGSAGPATTTSPPSGPGSVPSAPPWNSCRRKPRRSRTSNRFA